MSLWRHFDDISMTFDEEGTIKRFFRVGWPVEISVAVNDVTCASVPLNFDPTHPSPRCAYLGLIKATGICPSRTLQFQVMWPLTTLTKLTRWDFHVIWMTLKWHVSKLLDQRRRLLLMKNEIPWNDFWWGKYSKCCV